MSILDVRPSSEENRSQPKSVEVLSVKLTDSKNCSFKAIWENKDLEPVSKLILLSFSQRCFSQDSFKDKLSVSVKTLCEETNSSYQTVATHLKKLKEQGYLFIEICSHKKRIYNLAEKLFSDYEEQLLLQGSSSIGARLRQFEGGALPESLRTVKEISSSQKLLLLWLVSKSKDSKFLIPQSHRQEEMSQQLGLSKNSLTRAIHALEIRGLLHVIRTCRRPNVYALDESLFRISSSEKDFKKESPLQKEVPQELPSSSSQKGEETPRYSLYTHQELLPSLEEGKKPENQAFGIAKLLLTTGKEDIPLCSLTVQALSQYLLETFGLGVLKETEKLCFKYQHFGMTLYKLQWLCHEVYERKNPFQEPRDEDERKALMEERKQAEQKSKRLEDEVQKRYLAHQYGQKNQDDRGIYSTNQNTSSGLETPSESPLEIFRKKLMTICLQYYSGPEDRLLGFLRGIPLVNLRLFRNEYEKLPRERFENYMKIFIEKQFGSYPKRD